MDISINDGLFCLGSTPSRAFKYFLFLTAYVFKCVLKGL